MISGVLSGAAEAGNDARVEGRTVRERYEVTLAWTGLIPTNSADAIIGLNTATNFTEFRAAAEKFAVPSQNLIYADVEGNIGYQAPGTIPVRTAAIQGTPPGYWPAPGWDSNYDWSGFVPFAEMPWTYNPPSDVIVAANQAVTENPRPFLTTEWDAGYRATRISELLAETETLSPEDMREIQMDSHNPFAATLVNALLQIDTSDDPFTAEAQRLLLDWDYTTPADSSDEGASAAFYSAVWKNLLQLLFDDELPRDLWVTGGAQHQAAVSELLRRPDSPWWDNKQTPGITEERDEILRQALQEARMELTQQLGKDPGSWDWGKLHTVTFKHSVLGSETVFAPVRWLMNRGPHSLPGGPSIINANTWNANEGYEVVRAPAMRMVADLADLDNSTWVNQTGQSGHAYHSHYDDQIDAWASGEQFPWPHTESAVREAASDTLRLVPRD